MAGIDAKLAFCIIGIVFVYTGIQISIWMVTFTVFLFWGVAFPFSYRQLKTSGRTRHAHIISVTLAVVVPLPLALVQLKNGFILVPPSYGCIGRSSDYHYYILDLPASVLSAVSTVLLALIFWIIFKVE